MNRYQKTIEKELQKFKRLTDEETFDWFLKKIRGTDRLNKSVNIEEHICSFFVPYHKETGSVYLVHHIKADSWIPPGGHIDSLEDPVETVVREFHEELGHKIQVGQVIPLSASIKDISANPRNPCKIHFDFWYLVDSPKVEFKYLEREFYDARWMTIDEAMKLMDIPLYKKIVRSIKDAI